MLKISLTRIQQSYNILFILSLILLVITFALYSFSVVDQKPFTKPLRKPLRKTLSRPLVMFNKSVTESDQERTCRAETVADSVSSFITILKWTKPLTPPFNYLKNGRESFLDNNCKYDNCYVTDDKTYLESITDFDAIIFNGKNLVRMNQEELPQRRSQRQKYIFASMESPHLYPVCCENFDSYFNWTYTFRLDSDIRWGYFSVFDLEGNIVGPKIDMTWPEHMDPITADVVEILESKSQAAAWFISNCGTVRSGRHLFVRQLLDHLNKYKLFIDIYGECGPLKCSRTSPHVCFEKLRKDYYFYLAFENSFAEDYVTEKLITALNNYAVPIVFGAANYSRFLPPGSYLHAYELGAKRLAKTMSTIIHNRTLYHDFFRWRNHFKYKYTLDNDDVCKLCENLNDKQRMSSVTIVKKLRSWWNNPLAADTCKELLKDGAPKCPETELNFYL